MLDRIFKKLLIESRKYPFHHNQVETLKMFSPQYDQLTSVDNNCTKDEEKVDEHPTGEGRYALGNLSFKGIIKF